jgi:hypothetical protein
MSNRPDVGDRIEMPFMGSDADIEVRSIMDVQPLEADYGIVRVEDQYGEEHLVEQDADTWTTLSTDALSQAAFESYQRGIQTEVSRSLRR